jgi:hypothetical protein
MRSAYAYGVCALQRAHTKWPDALKIGRKWRQRRTQSVNFNRSRDIEKDLRAYAISHAQAELNF